MKPDDTLLIGLDGGATEAKAHAVARAEVDATTTFSLLPASAARAYPRIEGFEPLPVGEQLAQRSAGQPRLADAEIRQGALWTQAAADAIAEVAAALGARRIRVGAGMPGLKTPDGRGIDALNNGPRIPDYLEQLERGLSRAGLPLAEPIARLGSDADYCGLGEEHGAAGLFRDTRHAYYVGCGTGIADALKLRGALVPFDAAKGWIQKSWQMASSLGPTYERLVSARSLNEVFERLNPVIEPVEPGGRESDAQDGGTHAFSSEQTSPGETAPRSRPRPAYPEAAAAQGDGLAAAWLATAAWLLAELICERLCTVHSGRAPAAFRGAAYAALDPRHAYRGVVLERVVIGQRIGQIFAAPQYRALFAAPLERRLADFLARYAAPDMVAAWLDADGRLREGRLCASRLRAAPALGAAIAAYDTARGVV